MPRRYTGLTYADRLKIAQLCKERVSTEDIAEILNVHRGTLYRELQRGGGGNGRRDLYDPDTAQRNLR